MFERFFELSIDMLCLSGPDGYFKKVNAAFSRLGYTQEELLSKPFIEFVHPDDRSATQKEVENLLRGQPTVRFENRYRCKDGSYRWLSWTSMPDPSGIRYVVGRDITEEKSRVLALHLAKELAEDAAKELEAFNYSVSHDLRAPLRSIDGFTRILFEDLSEKLDDEGKKNLDRIRNAVKRMGQLIDDLLSLSRITALEIKKEPVDLSAISRRIANQCQASAPGRKVEWIVAEGIVVHGDEELLTIALDNLIRNAWKFTRNQPKPRIEVGQGLDQGTQAVFVRDNGAGFEMANAERMFGPFQRLHTEAEFEGTGIGLAIVKRIFRKHDGRIWARGKPGEGAVFHFCVGDGDQASQEKQ